MNRKGFTLMELLAVIVIIAIIMALVFPAASRLRRNNENKICVDYHNMMIEYAKSSIKDDEDFIDLSDLDGLDQVKDDCEGYVLVDRSSDIPKYSAHIACRNGCVDEDYEDMEGGKKGIVLTANNKVMVYSGEVPTFDYELSTISQGELSENPLMSDVEYIIKDSKGNIVTIDSSTPAGDYEIIPNAVVKENYRLIVEKGILTITGNKCNPPSNVTVNANGIITWVGSSNCPDATYQVRIGESAYENATSGVDKKAAILAISGEREVLVKTISSNNNYGDSDPASVKVNVCSADLTKGAGISSINSQGNYFEGSTVELSATVMDGYSWNNWTDEDNLEVSSNNTLTTNKCNIKYTANAKGNDYKVNYVDNLFAATAQETNGVTVTYDEANSYIKLNGTGTAKSIIPALWNYERRSFTAGDQYQITIKYISGTMTRASSSIAYPRIVIDMTIDGARFSDRTTAPVSAWGLDFPTSGEVSLPFTIDASRISANGLQYWIWEESIGNTTFTDYEVQIIITKVHSKDVTFGSSYGTLDTPTKTGHDFNGWWTQLNGGTQVTSSTTYNTVGDQTLYAHFTSHKLNVQYNGNASDVTFCGDTTELSMDSSKYAVKTSGSTRNIQTVGYGQYVSYSGGLSNWDNSNYICFSRTGYTTPSGQEWVLNGNTSKKYSDTDTTITTIGLANDAGCNLESTATCNARMNVNWQPNTYTVTFVDNLFVARSQNPNGVTATYTENGSYLTLDGITSSKWMVDKLWSLERRTINAGDQYKITIKYVSGKYVRKVDTSQNPRFYFELANSGEVFSDRTTAPVSYKLVEMPLSGENTATFTVDSSRASANGLNYRLYQQTASNFEFTDYKVQIIITQVHSKDVVMTNTYGTLPTPTKTGFTFDGWWTTLTGGTKVTNSSTYNIVGDQTLYAHWIYHKLHVKLRSNASGVTWCGKDGTAYSIDSSNYALKNDSRNIHNSGYGQYISHSSGLANYHNTSAVCFNRSGYTAVSGKEWKLTYDGTTTYYDQGDSTVTAASMSTKAGCNLKTTDECNATLYVNWTSSGGGSSTPTPTPAPTSSSGTVCTDEMACDRMGLGYWCHYGNLCYYARLSGANNATCSSEGCTWVCGSCYCSVVNAACS